VLGRGTVKKVQLSERGAVVEKRPSWATLLAGENTEPGMGKNGQRWLFVGRSPTGACLRGGGGLGGVLARCREKQQPLHHWLGPGAVHHLGREENLFEKMPCLVSI